MRDVAAGFGIDHGLSLLLLTAKPQTTVLFYYPAEGRRLKLAADTVAWMLLSESPEIRAATLRYREIVHDPAHSFGSVT